MNVKIGIDPGKHTGIAIMYEGKLKILETLLIHEAMDLMLVTDQGNFKKDILVIIEDPRKRSGMPEAAQGAGSIKRDAVIWEDFLNSLKISFKMVPPIKNGTRFRDQIFKANYPYWTKRTSEHARAAANLLIVH